MILLCGRGGRRVRRRSRLAGASVRPGPARAQFRGARTEGPHFLRGVMGELHEAELLAFGIEFIDESAVEFAAVECVEKAQPLARDDGGDFTIELLRPRLAALAMQGEPLIERTGKGAGTHGLAPRA